jgi:hypothetical protein
MKLYEWLTLFAIVVGPIIAVAITLWIEDRRKRQDAKLLILRMLLTTRDLPSDPGFQVGIKLVPVEFNDCDEVLAAHREFLSASSVDIEGKTEEQVRTITSNTSIKLTRLIFEMTKAAGLNIRETDIQSGTFGTRGFVLRELLLQDSQRAMRDIANILLAQTRLMSGEPPEQVLGLNTTDLLPEEAEQKGKKK